MSSNCIDYFAVAGKTENLECKEIERGWDDIKTKCEVSTLWAAAIIDISIIFVDKGEEVPDEGWEIIKDTIDGFPANLNSGDLERGLAHIAVRRRGKTNRIDHIVDINIVSRGDAIPEGFQAIQTSVSGLFPGDINTATSASLLVFKRAENGHREYFVGSSFVDDVCVIIENHGEEISEEYVLLDKEANSGNPNGDVVRIGYRKCTPLGMCDLKYKSATLDRYPMQDLPDNELPMNELPLFVFPRHLELNPAPADSYPLPDFFSMAFTGVKGDALYSACLQFFEVLESKEIERFCKEVYGVDLGCEFSELGLNFTIYCPKVICVISTNPFYRAMRRYLRQLYSMSISSPECPLEFFITSVVAQIPIPVEGGRPFNLHLDAALITDTARAMPMIRFENPPLRFFPHMDLDFSGPLRCFSIDKLLAVFCLMLQEAKILFICNSNALLTEVMETLRSLLFPLTWSSCFVSRLPDELCGLLQALGGFMIGLHLPLDNDDMTGQSVPLSSSEKKELFQTFFRTSIMADSMQPGTYVVDLSDNEIYQFMGYADIQPLSSSKFNSLLKFLPQGPRKRLTDRLQIIATEYHIGPQTSGLEIFDSAFEFQLHEQTVSPKQWAKFPTLDVRDAFMVFMVDLLGDYSKYIILPVQDLSQDVYRTFKEEFSASEYLADTDRNLRPLIESLLETQMFAVLLQQRSESSQFGLVFFESATEMLREMGLNAGGHGRPQGSWTMSKGVDLPVPLYKLLSQRRYASLVEAHSIRHNKSAGPLEKALARLEALESFNRTSDDAAHDGDHDGDGDDDDEDEREESNENTRDSKDIRQEIDTSIDLHLHDCDYGPLVVPGPTLASIDKTKEFESLPGFIKRGDEIQFSYKNGWPSLNKESLELAKKSVHPQIEKIHAAREYSHDKVDKEVRVFCRSPSERVSYRLSGRLLKEVYTTISKDKKASFGLMADVLSVSISMMSIRVLKKCRPVDDIMQIFGIVAELESMNMLALLDESVWRSVLVACARCGGDFMRGVSCVVFEIMKEIDIVPDAVTYGQYIRAVSAVKSTALANEGVDILDPFVHLEEMGLMWLVHRFYSITRMRVRGSSSSSSSSSRGDGNLSMSPIGSPPTSSRIADFFRGRSPLTDKEESAYGYTQGYLRQLFPKLFTKLGLGKVSGFFSISAPKGYTLPIIPRYTKDASVTVPSLYPESRDLMDHFDKIGTEIFNRYSDNDDDTQTTHLLCKEFSPFRILSSQPDAFEDDDFISQLSSSAPTSPLAKDSSANNNNNNNNNDKTPRISRWGNLFGRGKQQQNVEAVKNMTADLDIDNNGEEMRDLADLLSSKPPITIDTDATSVTSEATDTTSQTTNEEQQQKQQQQQPNSNERGALSPGAQHTRNNLQQVKEMFHDALTSDETCIGIHSHTACRCGFALLDEEVMSMWCGFGSGSKVSNPNLAQEGEFALDITSAHQLNCPQCRCSVIPLLKVRCYGVVVSQTSSGSATGGGAGAAASGGGVKQVEMLWEESVPHLSPFGLRFGIEETMQQIGEQCSDSSILHSRRSDLYWNLMWYFSRKGLPSGLLPLPRQGLTEKKEISNKANSKDNNNSKPFDGMVIVGWREHVVKVRAEKYLNGESIEQTSLTITDVFPTCTKIDIERVQVIVEQLRETLNHDSVKNALIEISNMPRLLESSCSGNATARNIYIVFLAILQLYPPWNPEESIPDCLTEGNVLDKIYNEVINTQMSDKDLEALGTTGQILKTCSPNAEALAIRLVFGHLL